MNDYYDTNEHRVLVMSYSIHCEYRVVVRAGSGGTSRAIEEAARAMCGTPNVDPESVRFRVET